jgi:hypothetical protein
MRKISVLFCVLLATVAFASMAPESPSPIFGRWEGTVQIPGRPFTLVIDLSSDQTGKWAGSVIVPGFNVKGAPLADLAVAVKDTDIAFVIRGVLGNPSVKGRLVDGAIQGEFAEGGNSAPVLLHRIGDAQVDLPPKSTPVRHELEGLWTGSLVYASHEFRVKLTLKNGGNGAGATLVLTREKDFPLTIGLVQEDGSTLTIQTEDGQESVDAKFDTAKGEIRGAMQIGGAEVPLLLHKEVAK